MSFYSLPVPVYLQNLLNSSFPILIAFFANLMQTSDYVRSNVKSSSGEIHDFIVVGGGSAGSAVAARLSEDPSTSVLLIEAGGYPNPITRIPGASPALNHPSIDYLYQIQGSNSSGLGLENGSTVYNRGRSLGGSSNQNFMIYQRGNQNDFDNWANITGDLRWRYSNVERLFRKMEDYHGKWPGHSKGGPIRIEQLPFAPTSKHILAAAEEMGFPIRDQNNLQVQSFSRVDMTQKKGSRFSTYDAYLKPNLGRSNLKILRYAQATKINFDDKLRAVSVDYCHHNKKRTSRARREVILCAGAIASPQLLMLSGIGPRDHLLEHGIKPLVDSSGVGANLQDHVATILMPFLLSEGSSYLPERDFTFGHAVDYMLKGTGPLTSPLSLSTIGFMSTGGHSPSWPNVQCMMLGIGLGSSLLQALNTYVHIKQSVIRQFLEPFLGQDENFVVVTLVKPKSRGIVRLKDGNPFSEPIIEPRYYSDEGNEDIQGIVDGMEKVVKLYENTTALGGKLRARLAPVPFPGCEQFRIRSRLYLECVARSLTLTLYHPVGTCSMGRRGVWNAVVDSELRVIGVKGLRVADASVMPRITNANTNAPTIMIGEMCAEMVREEWAKTY